MSLVKELTDLANELESHVRNDDQRRREAKKSALDNALAKLLAERQADCEHYSQNVTEIKPGIMYCWSCGKEWKK